MRAVTIAESTGPSGLRMAQRPSPPMGPEDIRVRVGATAINRADLLQTLGLYGAPPGAPSDIPGLEYAGTVAATGERVTRFSPGDTVMGLTGGGAWAEEVVAHEREAMAVPPAMSLTDAAAIPEAFVTSWDALVLQAGLSRGDRVLVHAATSGVGTAAVQLCTAWGAWPIGTGRSASKLERLSRRARGDWVQVSGDGSFAQRVRELTPARPPGLGGRGVEVVLDLVGGEWIGETLEAMTPGGTLMLVGLLGGASAEVPLRTLLSKRLRVIGTTLRSRPLEEKIALARAFEKQVGPLFADGTLAPVVDSVTPITEAAAALARLASNESFGKLVLTW